MVKHRLEFSENSEVVGKNILREWNRLVLSAGKFVDFGQLQVGFHH